MDLEALETDSVRSTADSSRNLLDLSQRFRQRKNKLAWGVVALVCFAGVIISFGFLFVQRSEFVQEKVHFSDVDSTHEIEPVAQAQQQNLLSFELPSPNREARSSATTTGIRSNATSDTNNNPAPQSGPRNNTTKRLPDNAQSKHPVSLLYEMKLAPIFKRFDCNNTALRHHPFFKVELTVSVNPETFLGYGPKLKIAKRIAAQQACTSLYNLTYSDPPNLDLVDDAERCGF